MLKEHIPVVLINAKAHDCINVLVGGTAHVSAFFKRDGNIELHVSVTFTFLRKRVPSLGDSIKLNKEL